MQGRLGIRWGDFFGLVRLVKSEIIGITFVLDTGVPYAVGCRRSAATISLTRMLSKVGSEVRPCPLRVLVVEDHETRRRAISRALRAAGFAVSEAAGGGECLAAATRQDWDAIVLKVRLPDMYGLEVCKLLKRNPLTAGAAVVCISPASDQAEDRAAGLENGAQDFLSICEPPRVLVATVRALAELRHAKDAAEEDQAEAAKAQLAAIVEHSDDAIMSQALDGTVKSWNRGAERLFGYSCFEVLGRDPSFLAPEGCQNEFPRALARLREGQTVKTFETERLRKDGTIIPVLMTISPIWDRPGTLAGASTIAHDITERRRAQARAESMYTALRRLSGELLKSQDQVQRRFARELHDGTAQTLAGITMNLSLLGRPGLAPGQFSRLLADTLEMTQQCSREVRAISYLMHPPLLDELGFISALRLYVKGFCERTGIRVQLELEDFGRLPADVETALFRIVQEALGNVHRHSGSQTAVIRTALCPHAIRLEVEDQGTGLPAEILDPKCVSNSRLGVGILGMRERAEQLGGHLDLLTGSTGTLVRVTLPGNGGQPL